VYNARLQLEVEKINFNIKTRRHPHEMQEKSTNVTFHSRLSEGVITIRARGQREVLTRSSECMHFNLIEEKLLKSLYLTISFLLSKYQIILETIRPHTESNDSIYIEN
jgi:hypothetical protein